MACNGAQCPPAPDVFGLLGNTVFAQVAKSFWEGYDGMLKDFVTSWVKADLLVPVENAAGEWFTSSTAVINVLLITIAFIIAGAKTALMTRGEPLKQVAAAFGRVVFVVAAGPTAIAILSVAGDFYSSWILATSGASSSVALVAFVANFQPALLLIVGLFGLLAVIFQWIIMIFRAAVLPLLVVFWPTAAAIAMIQKEGQAFQRVTAWILAFLIYSPVAASIYAFAWRLKNGDDGPGGIIAGLTIIVVAIAALPALIKLLMPLAGAMGSLAGGALAGAAIAATVSAGVAVGAAVATGGASAGASAGAGAGGGGAAAGGSAAGGSGAGGSASKVGAGSLGSGSGSDTASGAISSSTPADSSAGGSGATAGGSSSRSTAGKHAGIAAAGSAVDSVKSSTTTNEAEGALSE